ncbi:TlpA family protein disulfide reductase [Pirellulaceae bacterium SH449]
MNMFRVIQLATNFIAFAVLFFYSAGLFAQTDGKGLAGDDSNSLSDPAGASTWKSGPATLTWTNGETLPGSCMGLDQGALYWFADSLFRDPLEIDRNFLKEISFPAEAVETIKTDVSPKDFLIQLVDGGRIYGEIRQLDATHWTIFSSRLGEVKLRRDYVAAVQNLAIAGQWTTDRFDLNQWEAARGQKRFWQVNTLGQLLSTRRNIHLYREAELPETSLIEVELSWTKKLDMVLGLGVPTNARETDQLPRLETWDDSLVFSFGDNFEIVMESFLNKDRKVRLLIFWDQVKKRVAIHDTSGKLLCTADLDDSKTRNKPGIYIENKTGDLVVTEFRVRQSEPGFDSTRSSYQIANAPATNGNVISFDGLHWLVEPTSSISPAGSGSDGPSSDQQRSTISIPHSEFSNAFSLQPAVPSNASIARVDFHDGMLISGELLGIEKGNVRLATKASEEPLEIQINGARQITFPAVPEVAISENFTHQLLHTSGSIRGRLVPGSQKDSDIIHWQFPGTKKGGAFDSADAKILLQKRQAKEGTDEQWPDTLYFYNRDKIPCRVLGIRNGIVEFESFTQKTRVASSLLKAIDFGSSFSQSEIAPNDSNWIVPEKSKDAVVVRDEEIQLSDSATLIHPRLMRAGGFEFDFGWKPNTYGSLTLQVYGSNKENRGSTFDFVLHFYDSEVIGTIEGGRMQQVQRPSSQNARISIGRIGDTLRMHVDNSPMMTFNIPKDVSLKSEVKLSLNRVNENKFVGNLSKVILLSPSLNDPLASTGNNQRELLLTIPRIRKNNPPQHILRAENGDMVRGELIELDENAIQFKANQDLLMIPRSLVSTLIWLHYKPEELSAVTDSSNTVMVDSSTNASSDLPATEASDEQVANFYGRQMAQVLVSGDRRLTFGLTSWKDDQLIGYSEALGECSIPLDQIEELRFGSFATQALDVPYSDWVARLAPEPQIMTGAEGDQRSDMLFGTQSSLIGTEITDLKLPMLDGETLELSTLRGKVVVLDFWATWCGPCIRAMPDLIAATSEFEEEDVVLLAVNQDEDPATIREFLQEREWMVQVGLDNGILSRRLKVQAIPQTVIIGPDGKIAFVKVGYTSDLRQSLQLAIKSLLAN